MGADCIIAVSRHLSRFEPSLRLSQVNIYPQMIRAATPVLSRDAPPRLYIGIYYWGKNSFDLIRTCTHKKIRLDFSLAKPVYVLYIAGKNVKNCKVRSCLCALDPSIFYFILIKYGGKIWQLELSNLICKKNGNSMKSWKLYRLHKRS